MRQSKRPTTSRDKVRAHRQRLRQQGLRPIQIWVPDMRSRAFVTEAHRQSRAVARSKIGSRIGRLADEDLVRINRAVLGFLGVAAPNE